MDISWYFVDVYLHDLIELRDPLEWSDPVDCFLVQTKSTLVSMESFCSYFTTDVHAKDLVSMPKEP